MGVESDNSYKISRRTFFGRFGKNIAATAVGAAVGVELAKRKLVDPTPIETHVSIPNDVIEEAYSLYPSIPREDRQPRQGSISIFKPRSIVIGKNANGDPIALDYLQGNDLVKAFGYSDAELDEPRLFGIHDIEEKLTFTKPDGSLWTLRERIYERPDIYNAALRTRIDRENMEKRRIFIEERTIRTEVPKRKWTPLDTMQAGIAVLPALVLAARLGWRNITKPDRDWTTERIKFEEDLKQRAEEYIRPHLKQLEHTFRHYLLGNVRIPRSREINFYSLGYESEGGFDALVMSLLAVRYNLKANIVCVEANPATHKVTVEDWKRLEKMNVVAGEQNVEFRRADPAQTEFQTTDPSASIVIVLRNIDSIAVGRVANIKEALFPAMADFHRRGGDVVLMVSSTTPQILQELKNPINRQSQYVSDHMYFTQDTDLNWMASEEDGWSDRYISVLAFSEKPKDRKRKDAPSILLPQPGNNV